MMFVIFGAGVTGHATGAALVAGDAEVCFVDPPLGIFDGLDVDNAQAVFFCVPTPARDTSYVETAMADADRHYPSSVPFVVRSTIPPGTIAKLEAIYPLRPIILMPEFLRETTAVADAVRRDRAWFGCTNLFASLLFKELLTNLGYTGIRQVPIKTLELVKISLNTLLATKVAFANLAYDLAKGYGADYNLLAELMAEDYWVHPYGLQVPGRHGRGYAGTCLPKDTEWMIDAANHIGLSGKTWLEAMQTENQILLGVNK